MPAVSRIAAVTAVLGRACRGLVHPVIATFLLAAILSFLAADTLSGVYLLVAGLALVGDRMRRQPLPSPAPGPEPGGPAGPERPGQTGPGPAGRAGPAQGEPGERAGPESTGPELGEPAGPERGERAGPERGERAGPERGERAGPERGERAGPERGERAGPERAASGLGERAGPERAGPEPAEWAGARGPRPAAGPAGPARPWVVLSADSAAQRRAAMDRVRVPALIAAAAYAALIGLLGRFTWPATVLAVLPAVAGLAVAWVASAESQAPPRQPGWAAAAPWALVWVGAAAWEMTTLFLQPSLKTGSYAHPTLSYLVGQPLAAWPGRWAIAFGWLALGWYLARR